MCFKKIETMINKYVCIQLNKWKSIKRAIEVTKINHNQFSIQPYFLHLMFILFSLKTKVAIEKHNFDNKEIPKAEETSLSNEIASCAA